MFSFFPRVCVHALQENNSIQRCEAHIHGPHTAHFYVKWAGAVKSLHKTNK